MFQAATASILMIGLSLNSFVAVAQVTGKKPRFYIEAQFARTTAVFKYPLANTNWLTVEPWLGSIGYQLTSRLGVQASFTCYYRTIENTATGTTINGLAQQHYFRDDERNIALPMLLRYSLTPSTASRLNVDVIGGLVCVQARYESSIVETTDNVITRRYDAAEKAWNVLGTLGLGGQFSLNKHFAIVADAALCRNISATIPPVAYQAVGFPSGFTPRFGLGLRYAFDFKKPVATTHTP